MKIEVRLFSFFCGLARKEGNRYCFQMELKKGATCGDLLTSLNIPPNVPRIILVNGMVKNENFPLKEDDRVSILPPIEGGKLRGFDPIGILE